MLEFDEYALLMKAARLREVDDDKKIHWQAFLNFVVKAMKPVGKNKMRPVYSRFEKFYDSKKALELVEHPVKKRSIFTGIERLLIKGDSDNG